MTSSIKTGFFLLLFFAAANANAAGLQDAGALGKATAFNGELITASFGNEPAASTIPVPKADSPVNHIDAKYKAALDRLKLQAASIEKYVRENNYNSEYVFLVDMSLPSGKNRFFIYNLKKEIPEQAALVTHGVGSNRYNNDDPLQFSNMPYSFKTSIGKYKIGNSYYGRFGLAYKLQGLESTNDKALERAIVLHAHKEVPDTEPFPGYIIVSAGCPVVSPTFLGTLNKYISASKKPILLWIYN